MRLQLGFRLHAKAGHAGAVVRRPPRCDECSVQAGATSFCSVHKVGAAPLTRIDAMDANQLRSELERLRRSDGGDMSRQERGRGYERWLYALLDAAGLDPRSSYRPVGEEIDGSFVLDGRALLFEAKWTKDKLPASSIYAFKGKVDGKLIGTVGVYISMAGFTKDSIDALARGKDLNVILADDEDIEASLELGIAAVLRSKLRAAAEAGDVHFPVEVKHVNPMTIELPTATLAHTSVTVALHRLVVVVESREDRLVVAHFARRVMEHLQLPEVEPLALVAPFGIDVVTAGAFSNLPSTAAGLLGSLEDLDSNVLGAVILADSDFENAELRRSELAADERVRDLDIDIIVAEPTVATEWVGTEPDPLDLESYRKLMADIPVSALLARSTSFASFCEFVQRYAATAYAADAGTSKLSDRAHEGLG
jgi:hypothetical protein